MADALSRNPVGKLSIVMATQWRMMEDIIEVNPVCQLSSLMGNLSISNDLVDRIKVAQNDDNILQGLPTSVEKVVKGEDGIIRYEGRLCVPVNEELKIEILREAHHSKYTIHAGVTKMFQDMRGCIGGLV